MNTYEHTQAYPHKYMQTHAPIPTGTQTGMYTYSLIHIDTHKSVSFWFRMRAFGFLCCSLFLQRISHVCANSNIILNN